MKAGVECVNRKGEMKCSDHPKYRGLRKPISACERCWQIFFGIQDACINCGCSMNECEGEA